jgi:hypothetical protein
MVHFPAGKTTREIHQQGMPRLRPLKRQIPLEIEVATGDYRRIV